MPVTQEQQALFIEWLNKTGVKQECPACDQKTVRQVGDIVYVLSSEPIPFAKDGRQHIAYVEFICGRCNYVMLFLADKSIFGYEDQR